MFNPKNTENLATIERCRNEYKELKEVGNGLVQALKKYYLGKDIKLKNKECELGFGFEVFGLNFEIVLECSFATTRRIRKGRISTYIVKNNNKNERNERLFSYEYDERGDIEEIYSITDYPEYYFISFFEKIFEKYKDEELPIK